MSTQEDAYQVLYIVLAMLDDLLLKNKAIRDCFGGLIQTPTDLETAIEDGRLSTVDLSPYLARSSYA